MSGIRTHEIVNLIKSSDHWAEILKIAKDFRGRSNSETMALAKQKGLYRSRSVDARIVLEPLIVQDPSGVSVLVSFEVCRQQVKASVETPRGKLEEVTAVIGDEIKEHFEKSRGKAAIVPVESLGIERLRDEDPTTLSRPGCGRTGPRVEKTERKAGRRLSFVRTASALRVQCSSC